MLFNSLAFLVFAALFFLLWPLLRGRRNLRFGFLCLASFVFYGWWDWRYLILILGSGLLDFCAGLAMGRWEERKRLWLWASLLGNLGCLIAFKYLGFLTTNLDQAVKAIDASRYVPVVELALPVGISFYTFQSMSYTIDVYLGRLKPTRNPLKFFAYLAMFPQLVAGPIVRARELLPQLDSAEPATPEQRWEGLVRIAHGFFKKCVLADNLAPAVALAFGAGAGLDSGAYWWLAAILFAFQIYFDFSGYSDIACGLGEWLGLSFPENFRHPYQARSLRDFWGRWHISLSTWFRDYVYVPLGGSRGSTSRAHRNMWITMVVSGLWHGANWTFVVWGALHAAFLSLERVSEWPRRLEGWGLPGRVLSHTILLIQVLVAWVFFRATSLPDAVGIVVTMFDPTRLRPAALGEFAGPTLWVLLACVLHELYFAAGLSERVARRPRLQELGVALLLFAAVYLRGPGSAFIYFQF